jgi:hypothetical protein
MAPITIGDGIRSKSDCVKHNRHGIVTDIKHTIKQNKQTSVFYVRWEEFKCSVPHSRKSLSRDNTIRDNEKVKVSKKMIAKEQLKIDNPDIVYSSDDEIRKTREYKPTGRDYNGEKKEKKLIAEAVALEQAAAEAMKLEALLEANLVLDKTIYITPDVSKVTFRNYIQSKHRIASDHSTGPTYVFV